MIALKKLSLFLLVILFSAACIQAPSTKRLDSEASIEAGSGNGGAIPSSGNSSGSTVSNDPVVEVLHLIEPDLDDDQNSGDYVRKMTLPKNYQGNLYLAGINIGTLTDRIIKVRFKFGRRTQTATVEVDAVVASAPGLVSGTSIQVLILDLTNQPFRNINLLYELYDYNQYSFDGVTSPLALTEPVQSNRDSNLYCRGLDLEDDETFSGSIASGCINSGEKCLYSYAKVTDKGLIEIFPSGPVAELPLTPTYAQIEEDLSSSYGQDDEEVLLKRCLPDEPPKNISNQYYYDLGTIDSVNYVFTDLFSLQTINGTQYRYDGPYRLLDTAQWKIGGNAIVGENGIFRDTLFPGSTETGFKSNLFPRYTQFNLGAGVEHLSSSSVAGPKAIKTLAATGKTGWMDGCNKRVRTFDSVTREHYGSCNVTATIEVIAIDDDGNEEVVTITDEVKLQLVSRDAHYNEREDVLDYGYNSCTSTSQCGLNECCFNNRCWSEPIVSQCADETQPYGQYQIGAACSTDLQCNSLCCNQSTGRCAPHDDNNKCSKTDGQFCIAKEWCQEYSVTKYYIIDTGDDGAGNATCRQRAFYYLEHGDCVSNASGGAGRCQAPEQDNPVNFDPNNPDCSGAIDLSQVPQGYYNSQDL